MFILYILHIYNKNKLSDLNETFLANKSSPFLKKYKNRAYSVYVLAISFQK